MTKIVPQKMIEELRDENNLTIARQKEILKEINARVDEIWKYICKSAKAKLEWYDYDNLNGENPGFFDPVYYDEFICIAGCFDSKKLFSLDYGFPTEFLWDKNYQVKVKQILEQDKKEEEDKYKQNKEKQRLLLYFNDLDVNELKSLKKYHKTKEK